MQIIISFGRQINNEKQFIHNYPYVSEPYILFGPASYNRQLFC